jgi:hypothetical protein
LLDSFDRTHVCLIDGKDLALVVVHSEVPDLIKAFKFVDEVTKFLEVLALDDEVVSVGHQTLAAGGLPEELLRLESLLEVDVEEERREHAALRNAGVGFDEDVAEESLGVAE